MSWYVVESGGDGAEAILCATETDMKQAVHDLQCCGGCDAATCDTAGIADCMRSLDDDDYWSHHYPDYQRFSWGLDLEDGYIRVLNLGPALKVKGAAL